jgi:glycosyltransferase involved in cell wall biosynthesis
MEFRRRVRELGVKQRVNSLLFSPPGMRAWFRSAVEELAPDYIFMTYLFWDGLLEHQELWDILTVVDTQEIASLNTPMEQEALRFFGKRPLVLDEVPDEALALDFYKKLKLRPSRAEFRLCDKYDYTISIAPREFELIEQHVRRTKLFYLPVTCEPVLVDNTYQGPALFPSGPNPFNVQGYCFFARHVLPLILKADSSFELALSGVWSKELPGAEHVRALGYVPSMSELYQNGRVLISPVFGGTGQQVKIVEAMAHGLPVVAIRDAVDETLVVHGETGYLAEGREDFAEYCLRLWQDEGLARKLGEAARENVRGRFSGSLVTRVLEEILS